MKNKILKCFGIFMAVCMIALNFSNLFAAVIEDTDFDEVITNFNTEINKELKENPDVTTTLEDSFSRNGDSIEAKIDGKTTEFKYDFATDYTFYKDITYTKDMTYDESMDAYEESSMPMYGFLILATNKGCKALDSSLYMALSLLDGLDLSNSNIVDTSTITNGVEFVNTFLNEDTTIDKELFTFKSTKISEEDDKIVIRNSVTVKYDEDFSIIDGMMDKFKNNSGSNEETPKEEENTNNVVDTNTTTNSNQSKKEWPKAGVDIKMNNILAISIGVAALALVTLTVLKKNTIKE